MQYRLCDNPWGKEEIEAIHSVIDSDMYTMGPRVREFECAFEQKLGVKHAVMVNSGSTANLLAIAALVYSDKLPRGSEVIVPAVSWSTTYSPLEQFGMKPVFVDIDKDTLNISVEALKNAISEQTKMILLVNLLGNPNYFDEIFDLCQGKDILIMEDNCESLGAKYKGKSLGTLGLIGTYSSFYSHHICTMEGGVVATNDDLLYEFLLALRAHGWTRNLPENGHMYQKSSDPFYESFNFVVPGFNVRPLEMEGAIGVEQLKKLDDMVAQRRENAAYFREKMKEFPDIRLQKENEYSSWFAFAMVLEGELKKKRNDIANQLRLAGIETRPVVAGNYTRNPVIKYYDYKIPAPLTNADDIHDHGFYIGNHSANNFAQIDFFVSSLKKIIQEVR